jgi:hypothetical protein
LPKTSKPANSVKIRENPWLKNAKNCEKYRKRCDFRAKTHANTLYNSREYSTNQPFYAKQTQFSPFFTQKRRFRQKTNPIQTQSKPILAQYQGWQSQTKPIQTQFYPRVYPRVLLPRLTAGECELTLLLSLPRVYPRVLLTCLAAGERVLTDRSAGGRGSNPISKINELSVSSLRLKILVSSIYKLFDKVMAKNIRIQVDYCLFCFEKRENQRNSLEKFNLLRS